MRIRFIYRNLRAKWRDQRAEIGFLLRNIKKGDVVVDCGANKGSYIFSLSRAVGPHGKVIAFEPQPTLYSYLMDEVQKCKLSNVVVEKMALSDTIGSADIYVPGGEVSPGASLEKIIAQRGEFCSYRVPVTTLDSYFETEQPKISAIKIDVEGHELAVLKGAVRIIGSDRPALVVECEQRHLTDNTVNDVCAWILEKGYEGWFVCGGKTLPLNEFRIEKHQPVGLGDFWNDKKYYNNFLFSKKIASI